MLKLRLLQIHKNCLLLFYLNEHQPLNSFLTQNISFQLINKHYHFAFLIFSFMIMHLMIFF